MPPTNVVAYQADGKVLVAGNFGTLYRLANNTLDSTFGSGGHLTTLFAGTNDGITAVAVQGDGKFIVAGIFGGTSAFLARYTAEGELDSTFGTDGKVAMPGLAGDGYRDCRQLVVLNDGRFLAIGSSLPGSFPPGGGEIYLSTTVARFTARGGLDASYGVNGVASAYPGGGRAMVLEDGSCYVLAQNVSPYRATNGSARFRIMLRRFSAQGVMDTSYGSDYDFGPNRYPPGQSPTPMTLLPDGRLLTVVHVGPVSFTPNRSYSASPVLLRFGLDGRLDTTFGVNGEVAWTTATAPINPVNVLARQSDGNFILGGGSDAPRFPVVRVTSEGGLDANFGTTNGVVAPEPRGRYEVVDLALRDDGSIRTMANFNADPPSVPEHNTVGEYRVSAQGTVLLPGQPPPLRAPSFTPGGDVSAAADAGEFQQAWATAMKDSQGAASANLEFIVTNDAPALFSVAPAIGSDGTLTFRPSADASGTAHLSVSLRDSSQPVGSAYRESAPSTFAITITASLPPLRAPSFASGGDVSVTEDSGGYRQAWATEVKDSRGATSGNLEFMVTNDTPALFSVAPAISPAGVLTFRPAADANGTAEVSVTLRDKSQPAGSEYRESAAKAFTISVSPVNDAPSFVPGNSLIVGEHAGAQSIPNWATQIEGGPAEEVSQPVHFEVSVNHPEYFAVAPSLSAAGTIEFTPAAGVLGIANVTIRLLDAGGAQSAPVVRQIQIAHTSLAGTYRALLQAPLPTIVSIATSSLEVPPTYHNQCGQVSLTATAAGRVTGQIVFASGRARAFTGRFDEAGQVFFQPGDRSALALAGPDGEAIDLRLKLNDDLAYPTLTGSLNHAETSYARISGGLAPFTAAKNPRAPLRTFPADLAGRYTAALFTAPPSVENPSPAYPRGSGVATLAVNRAGLVTLSGIMPDNVRIAYSGPVLGDMSVPLYIRTYQGRGSLSGFVNFRDQTETDLDSANLYWSSPGNHRQLTPWDGVKVSLAGAKYTGTGFIGAMPFNHIDYHLDLAFNFGPLSSFGGDLRITSGVTTYSYTRDFSVRVNRATGLITGAYRSQDSYAAAPFHAAILSKQSTAYGYVQEGGRTGDVTIAPKSPQQ